MMDEGTAKDGEGLSALIKEINENAQTFMINPPIIVSEAFYKFTYFIWNPSFIWNPRRVDRFKRDNFAFDRFSREADINFSYHLGQDNRFERDNHKFDRFSKYKNAESFRRVDRFKRDEI